jgi:hypothetical protein
MICTSGTDECWWFSTKGTQKIFVGCLMKPTCRSRRLTSEPGGAKLPFGAIGMMKVKLYRYE